jgi:hypothetical protein
MPRAATMNSAAIRPTSWRGQPFRSAPLGSHWRANPPVFWLLTCCRANAGTGVDHPQTGLLDAGVLEHLAALFQASMRDSRTGKAVGCHIAPKADSCQRDM